MQVTPAADLAVTINPGPGGPCDGSNWTYTVSVNNLGLSDATGVIVSSAVARQLHVSPRRRARDLRRPSRTGSSTASLGAIPAGQSATVTFVVVPTSVDPIDLSASVAGNQYDPVTCQQPSLA